MRDPLQRTLDISTLNLDPNLHYLKLEINGQESLLVMGYQIGDEKIWFSSDKAIFKTKNGYLSGMSGFPINWNINESVDLSKLPLLGMPTAYTRSRNVMPGYQFDIRESVSVTPLSIPPKGVPAGQLNKPWRWFSESVNSQYGGQKAAYNYPGIIALDLSMKPYQVRYAEQCLTPDYCLKWQPIAVNVPSGIVESK